MLLLTKPVAIELSVLIGVEGCECPNEWIKLLIESTILELWKTPAISDSEAEETKCFSPLHYLSIAPFNGELRVLLGWDDNWK